MQHRLFVVIWGAMVAAAPVQAHHAAGAAFMEEEIQIEGIVSEFNFVNPHVNIILSVTGDDGAEVLWQATAPAPVSLRRSGWSADSLEVGQYLGLTGYRSRDGRPMILVENEHWDGGGIVELDPADGSIVRTLTATPGEVASIPTGPALTHSDGRPNFAGTWDRRPGSRAREAVTGNRNPPFNEYGASVQAAFDSGHRPDVYRMRSQWPDSSGNSAPGRAGHAARGIVSSSTTSGALISGCCTWTGRGPETGENTRLGHSAARYEDDALVVETTQLLGDLTGTAGNAVGERAHGRGDVPARGRRVRIGAADDAGGHRPRVPDRSLGDKLEEVLRPRLRLHRV